MINFNIAGVVVDDLTTDLRGLSDVKIVTVAGRLLLVVASEADSALTTYTLSSSGVPQWADSQKFSTGSGTGRVWSLNFAEMAGEVILLPATRYEDQTRFYTLQANGQLSAPAEAGITGTGIGQSETVTLGADTFIYVQEYGGQTLVAYRMGSDQRLSRVQELKDTKSSFLGDISALEQARVGGKDFLVVASAFDAGLGVYQIGADGRLSLRDTVAPDDGSGFAKAQDLISIELEGQDFVIMASAGTSSLTVYRITGQGKLVEVDHMIDTLETRFQNAALLEEFSFEGRQFLVTAGSDDGITVLEVLAGGVLRIEGSLADSYATTLDNISGIAVEILNGIPVLFIASASEAGFTRIELSITPLPQAIEGTGRDDVLTGTTGDDLMRGRAGDDDINGGAGDDVLVDGTGTDRLFGSQGVDVFTFVKDGQTDVIADFNPEFDLIDLSGFGGVSSFADLRIIKGCEGLMIWVESEFIVLEVERHNVELSDLTAGHFIF